MNRREMILLLDQDDFDVIQNEIARRQRCRWPDGSGPIVPDGDSNMVGVMLAECVRDLNEYRDLHRGK